MKLTGVLFLILFLLTGCDDTPKEIERGMAFRSLLLRGNGYSFDAKITADYVDSIEYFAVSCTGNSEGALSFTVTEPETIAGITGDVSEEAGILTFDTIAVQLDKMAENRVTPVSAPWIFLKTLRSGYIRSGCMEGELLRLTLDDSFEEDALQLDIWMDERDVPIRGEILWNGRRILTLDIENFTVL